MYTRECISKCYPMLKINNYSFKCVVLLFLRIDMIKKILSSGIGIYRLVISKQIMHIRL